ncbi:hypothetical protein Cob_v002346 [Colletotrichum orbiculare MAFF 240422]|uniref:Uncharacterized protein n=1 Tax=Colletotrichum orbiculare (strain 104-T / ATCC 96160 / CBS 514.97 / LARS 414 / MAFF 240422) TaxID=1213857 RepID=A0A484G4V7_COLOR|nr:hypothetical protein Cob_v002346 [Colletotrichum orbiculare MAFF 240422]
MRAQITCRPYSGKVTAKATMKFSAIIAAFTVLASNVNALHQCKCQLGNTCQSFSQVEDNQSCTAFCKQSFSNSKTC